MTKTGFEWVIAPEDEIIPALDQYAEDVFSALHAVAAYWGANIQNEARDKAKWIDRTANARSGIFFAVDGFGLNPLTGEVTAEQSLMTDVSIESGNKNTLIIALSHTVFYGKFLELSHGGKNAIIMSTIEENLPQLERMVTNLFKG